MDEAKRYKLLDLIEDIKKTDAMITLHSSNASGLMLDQYKAKKEKLIGYLIDELVEPDLRSARSFAIIKTVIEKFYPHLGKEVLADSAHLDLTELEAILAA